MSSIKQKVGLCKDCNDGKVKPLIAGRCKFHYWQYRNKKSKEKELKKNNNTSQMDVFLSVWNKSDKRSQISGRTLMPFYLKYLEKRTFNQFNWCFAHIIAKGKEKSLKFNEDNILLVHPEEHTLLDQGYEEQRMKYEKEYNCSFDIFYNKQEELKKKYEL